MANLPTVKPRHTPPWWRAKQNWQQYASKKQIMRGSIATLHFDLGVPQVSKWSKTSSVVYSQPELATWVCSQGIRTWWGDKHINRCGRAWNKHPHLTSCLIVGPRGCTRCRHLHDGELSAHQKRLVLYSTVLYPTVLYSTRAGYDVLYCTVPGTTAVVSLFPCDDDAYSSATVQY